MSRVKRLLALLLALTLLPLPAAFAEAEDAVPSLLDEAQLQRLVEDYLTANSINPERVSVGFVYTETGDSWYYNPDTWYYSASTYKVPVIMLLAQKEAAGELTRDSLVGGMPLGYVEETILTYSHNEYAHMMMSVLAPTEPECRDMYKQFVDLPDDYYISDFRDYSYFTARFLTQVMTTLYNDPERFPNVIDCLLNAQPEHYFRIYLGQYPIAQKYGSFQDISYRNWNHTTGIIYLPHPIIVTVMTRDVSAPETVIAELANLLAQYSLGLDEKLETMRAAEEAARLAAEEAARATPEPTPLPTPEPTSVHTSEPTNAPAPAAQSAEESAAPAVRRYVLLGTGGILCLLVGIRLAARRRH